MCVCVCVCTSVLPGRHHHSISFAPAESGDTLEALLGEQEEAWEEDGARSQNAQHGGPRCVQLSQATGETGRPAGAATRADLCHSTDTLPLTDADTANADLSGLRETG